VKILAFLLLLVAAPSPDIRYLRYERPLQNLPAQASQACVVIDPPIFEHSSPGLSDLRLYREGNEVPYLIHTSAPASSATEQSIAPLNLGTRNGKVAFDAAMPPGPYSDLQLKITGEDFIASVSVAGTQQQTGAPTKIGTYTIFDLTRQRLGRSTVLHLPTSDFRYLHFTIVGPLKPEAIGGISLQQASESHPAYVTVAETTQAVRKEHSTIIEFTIPAKIPVERVSFTVPAQPVNFSRDVTVSAAEIPPHPLDESAPPPQSYASSGNLLRVHIVQDDHRIDQESLQIDTFRTAFNLPSRWTISIDNGDNTPLLPTSVRLEMFERDLCFQSSPGNYTLYYGDPALSYPRYDIGQFLVIKPGNAARLTAGPEQSNPLFQPRPDDRPFTERHPALLWIALALVILLLGVIALRSARSQNPAAKV
jgi:hypothetical protein